VVPPDPLFPAPSTSSAMKTHDSWSPHPSASLQSTVQTKEKQKEDPDTPELAAEQNMQMKYPCDLLFRGKYRSSSNKT
jgi:hypothetical protein